MTAGVGSLLRQYRRDAGLTQEALAERAGYSTVYVSMLERGQRVPQRATLDLLADALDLPEARRTALIRAAGQGDGNGDLVGRARELELLERHLSGDGPAVLAFAGEPGIGKSHLLREAGRRAAAFGWQVLAAGCSRRGGQEPYAPLPEAVAGALRPLSSDQRAAALDGCAWMVSLLPELAIESSAPATLTPAQERRLVVAALRRLVTNVRGTSGTLLLLDDLQWAGADALDLLAALLADASGVPLRVILAYRDTEVRAGSPFSGLLTDLAREGGMARHLLGPLSEGEAASLLDRLADPISPEQRERLLRTSGGVPFFLVSLSQAVRSGGMPRLGVPWDLAQSVRERIVGLSLPAQDALTVAAVAGRRAPQAILAAAVPNVQDLSGVLDEICAAGLLVEDEDGYRFSHDVIREVVESDLSAARRTALHRRVADALESRPEGAAPEVLAYHYARSDDGEKALRYLARAGERAYLQHAYRAAEGYYRELIDRLESLGRRREQAEAQERLGEVLSTAGRYDEALATLETVAAEYGALGDREAVGLVVAAIGRIHYRRGTAEEGIDRLRPLCDVLVESEAPRALSALHAALAPLFLSQGQYAEQLAEASRAAELARMLGDDRVLVEAEVWRGCALSQLGQRDEGRAVQEAVIALAEAHGDVVSLMHALNDVGFAHEQDGRFDRSRSYKERALAVAERMGDPAAIANMAFRWGQNAFLRGDTSGARVSFERARRILQDLGPSALSSYPDFGLALLALATGDASSAGTHAERSLLAARNLDDRQAERAAAALLAELDLHDGRAECAVNRLAPLAGDVEGLGLHPLETTLAEALWRLGKGEEARRWAEWSVRQAEIQRNRIALVEGLRVMGLTADDPAERERLLRESRSLAREMGYAFGAARADAALATLMSGMTVGTASVSVTQ